MQHIGTLQSNFSSLLKKGPQRSSGFPWGVSLHSLVSLRTALFCITCSSSAALLFICPPSDQQSTYRARTTINSLELLQISLLIQQRKNWYSLRLPSANITGEGQDSFTHPRPNSVIRARLTFLQSISFAATIRHKSTASSLPFIYPI